MRRQLLTTLPLVALLGSGCLGNFNGLGTDDGGNPNPGSDGGTQVQGDMSSGMGSPQGRDLFDTTVDVMLEPRCAGCHGRAGGVGPAFIKPVAYDSIISYPGIVVADPTASILITKGAHNGAQWWSTSEQQTVVAWLTVEAQNIPVGGSTSVSTKPQALQIGSTNDVPLDNTGAAGVGATISFDATLLGSTLELDNLTLNAKGATGVHVVHPLFIIIHNGVKNPDPVDSLSNVDESVAQGNSTQLGPGTLFLQNVGALDQIAIAFKSVSTYSSTGGGGMDGGIVGGACKDDKDFTGGVQPTLSQRCFGCHGGNNGSATAALDMTKLNDLSAMAQDTACGQVKTKIDTTTPANSPIFAVTKPGNNSGHPYKFPDTTTFGTFQTTATTWINQEK